MPTLRQTLMVGKVFGRVGAAVFVTSRTRTAFDLYPWRAMDVPVFCGAHVYLGALLLVRLCDSDNVRPAWF